MTRRNLLTFITTVALLAVSFAAVARQQTTYRLTHLGTTTPFGNPITGFNFTGINDKSELVGHRLLNGVWFSFIWRDGEFRDLNPPVNTDAFAFAINDRSDVVGVYIAEEQQLRRFLWRRGEVTLIEHAPGLFAGSLSDINNRREVLISAADPQGLTVFFVWRNGQVARLEPPPCCPGWEDGSSPLRLNDRGAVVGTGGDFVPMLWEPGTIMQIQLPQGARIGSGEAINNRGAVVGTAYFPDFLSAERSAGYLWHEGQATELRSPLGFANTGARDINNRGVIVGWSNSGNPLDPGPQVATIWPRRGDPADLHSLIADDDPLKPFVRLDAANLINDRGVIVAVGTDSRDMPNITFSRSWYLLTAQH